MLAKIFFDTVVRLHGLPDDVVSDRDPKFTGHFWRALFKHIGVKLSMSTAYHPQSDGQTERDNRTLESILRNFVSTNFDNWDTLLPAAEFSYNNSKQKSTQETPFFLNYGMHPVTPLDRNADAPIHYGKDIPNSVTKVHQSARFLYRSGPARMCQLVSTWCKLVLKWFFGAKELHQSDTNLHQIDI